MKKDYISYYSDLEEKHWWWQARRFFVSNELNKIFLKSKNKSKHLIDIGCGAGFTIKSLKDKFKCIGIEPDKHFIRFAHKNTGVPIKKGFLPNGLPKLRNKADIVLLLDVLEHVKEDKKSLKKISSLMLPGGYLILNVPAMRWMWSVHDEINDHKKRYERKDLQKVIVQSGFEIVKLRYWGVLLLPLAYFIERKLFNKNNKDEYSVHTPSPLINKLVKWYCIFEYKLTEHIPLPFGLSLFAVLKKK